MATEDDFDKAFEGFGEDPAPTAVPKAEPPVPPAQPDAAAVPPVAPPKEGEDDADKNKPGDKPEDTPKPDDQKPVPSSGDKPAGEAEDSADGSKPPAAGTEDKPVEEEPKPLTEDSVTSIIQNIRTEERASEKELENTTKDVLDAYYPDGLSNVLVDQASGKELRTPADVVAVAPDMSMEDAAQWLMNEQYKLDQDVSKIRQDAKLIAETTVNFKRDSVAALQKYEPLFKAYPQLQEKSFNLLMKQVKADKEKGVILVAPDVLDLYDTYLEPYQLAYEHSTKQSATNPVPDPATPPAPKPGAEDRLDEGGDGGATAPDDPNDFAQQVTKELAKGI